MPADIRVLYGRSKLGNRWAYGAMIIRAPGIGSCWVLIWDGTWDSQVSSSLERVEGREVYQEPAWLASRVVIL